MAHSGNVTSANNFLDRNGSALPSRIDFLPAIPNLDGTMLGAELQQGKRPLDSFAERFGFDVSAGFDVVFTDIPPIPGGEMIGPSGVLGNGYIAHRVRSR